MATVSHHCGTGPKLAGNGRQCDRGCAENRRGSQSSCTIWDRVPITVKAILREIWEDQTGVVTVEYALLLAVLVVGGAAVWSGLRDNIANTLSEIETTVSSGG